MSLKTSSSKKCLALLLSWTKPNPTHQKTEKSRPTQPMGQPNLWTTLPHSHGSAGRQRLTRWSGRGSTSSQSDAPGSCRRDPVRSARSGSSCAGRAPSPPCWTTSRSGALAPTPSPRRRPPGPPPPATHRRRARSRRRRSRTAGAPAGHGRASPPTR